MDETRRENGEWHPKEEKHRGKERQFWRATIALYLLTFIATAAAALFAAGAYSQAKKQADVAQEALYATYHPIVDVSFSNTVLGSTENGFKPSVDIKILAGNEHTFTLETGEAIITSGRQLSDSETIYDFCDFGQFWRITDKSGEMVTCKSHRELKNNDAMDIKIYLQYRDELGTYYAQKLLFYFNKMTNRWEIMPVVGMNVENRFGSDGKIQRDLH